MAFDFKKEYRKFYCPKNKPAIVDIPAMNYIAVRGEGDPNPEDSEPETVALMHEYMLNQGYALDITDKRLHHEIYLSDARKTPPEKLKTVIRHPIRQL